MGGCSHPFFDAIRGRAACICAGGQSLAGQLGTIERYRREHGLCIIGVNETGFRINSHFTVVYDWDKYDSETQTWAAERQQGKAPQVAKVDGYPGIIFAPQHYVKEHRYNLVPVPIFSSSVYGLTCDFEYGLYCNGGAAGLAISIAYYLGASPILLCGYEYSSADYWYGGSTPDMFAMINQRDELAKLARITGNRVINCSAVTTLEGFPQMRLEDAERIIN